MKIRILFIFVLFFNNVLFSKEIIDENKIYKNLRCLVCQGQSVAGSNSDFAQTLKLVIKDLIDQGKSEQEIYKFLAEKYGDWILYNPPLNSKNIILWSFPYIILILGGIIIVFLIKNRSKKM